MLHPIFPTATTTQLATQDSYTLVCLSSDPSSRRIRILLIFIHYPNPTTMLFWIMLTPVSSSTARKPTTQRSSSPLPLHVVTHPIGRVSYYNPGPTKFSSPLQQPPSSHSTPYIPTPPAPIVRPPTPRPPLPQQPPPQFYYQQYQILSSWNIQTSAPHQPEEELLIDLSPDTDHEMTPPDVLHSWVIFLFLYLLFLYFYFILLMPALLRGPLDLPAHS